MYPRSSKAPSYRYAVFSYQPDVAHPEGAAKPFAVIVQGKGGIFAVGTGEIRTQATDEVSETLLGEFPKSLAGELHSLLRTNPRADVTRDLASVFRWNIFVGHPEKEQSELPIDEYAFALFARLVGERSTGRHQPGTAPVQREHRLFEVEVATPELLGAF